MPRPYNVDWFCRGRACPAHECLHTCDGKSVKITTVTARVLIFGLVAMIASAQTVVVELFTSEGCSTCPPADQMLSRLESPRNPSVVRGKQAPISLPAGIEVIALGEHVDYWDQLGWKDRFSSPLFSARQQDYGRAFHLESVYTPEMIVNGQKEMLGSDPAAIREAISRAAKEPQARVVLAMTSAQTVSFSVSRLPPGSHEAELLLGVTESGLVTSVYGGENGGRQLRHAAVVRTLTSLGRLDPTRPGEYSGVAQLNLRQDWNRANVKLVLFIQDRVTQHILGAASVRP